MAEIREEPPVASKDGVEADEVEWLPCAHARDDLAEAHFDERELLLEVLGVVLGRRKLRPHPTIHRDEVHFVTALEQVLE